MPYRVRLDLFEGPLDLLLHLVKKNEVDVTEIPIATITDQYLAYLDMLQEMNLDIAGEFLVMAATLIHIKSRCLLPAGEDEDQDDEEGDPRAELIERLREYQRFREAALELGRREILMRDVFARPSGEAPDEPPDATAPRELRDASLGALLDAFRNVLRRATVAPVHEVLPEGLTIRDCIGPILACLGATARASFDALFPPGASRHRVIVTFLTLLELMRIGVVRAQQAKEFDELIIVLAVPSIEEAERLTGGLEFGGLVARGEG